MKILTIKYKIPDKLANQIFEKGINFERIKNQIMIGEHELGMPAEVLLGDVLEPIKEKKHARQIRSKK